MSSFSLSRARFSSCIKRGLGVLSAVRTDERHHISVGHYHHGERTERPHFAVATVAHCISSFALGTSFTLHPPAPADGCFVLLAPSQPPRA